jgi:hypothetical protein
MDSAQLIPSPPMETILSQFHPTPILTSYFPQIGINVILLCRPSFKWMFPKLLPTKIQCDFSRFSIQAIRTTHHKTLDFTILIVGPLGDRLAYNRYVNDQTQHCI